MAEKSIVFAKHSRSRFSCILEHMRPVIALLSDFGTRDHYAGTMKGVMLAICPEATLVDITHEVAAHDVMEGALQLAAAARYFPAGTIFLAVVDPGVGSSRRGIAAEAGDYRFVAPDNGVLTAVLREWAPKKIVELTDRRYARPTVSRTFEGRDRFAPAAGWLAKGIQLTALGRPAPDYYRLDIPVPQTNESTISGVVLRIDRFGNLVTNIDRRTFEAVARSGTMQVRAGGHAVGRLVATYADIQPGEICALFGSTEHLELAANAESAAERLQLTRGALVDVTRTA
jgi:S-adenosylmethionine hydrolase